MLNLHAAEERRAGMQLTGGDEDGDLRLGGRVGRALVDARVRQGDGLNGEQ